MPANDLDVQRASRPRRSRQLRNGPRCPARWRPRRSSASARAVAGVSARWRCRCSTSGMTTLGAKPYACAVRLGRSRPRQLGCRPRRLPDGARHASRFWLGNGEQSQRVQRRGQSGARGEGTGRAAGASAPPRGIGSRQDWRLLGDRWQRQRRAARSIVARVRELVAGRRRRDRGVDYRLSAKTLIGAAGGRRHVSISAPDAETSGRRLATTVAFYGARREDYYMAGNVAFSSSTTTCSRHVFVPGASCRCSRPRISSGEAFLSGNATSHAISGSAEAAASGPLDLRGHAVRGFQ